MAWAQSLWATRPGMYVDWCGINYVASAYHSPFESFSRTGSLSSFDFTFLAYLGTAGSGITPPRWEIG